ncbi:sister chromatid cohesion C-terminus-domain-containing protein [Blakeslea trispora]|nr:sister chromatid cohesion C-terminus-domain-containing protein [Blakeslea trispora]
MYSLQEYRAILELILQDIITVMNDPDWPVAELIIRILSRVLITLLEGSSSDQYLKSLAIEWLGTIAGKIKIDLKKLSKDDNRWVHDLNQKLPQRIDIKTDLASLQLLYQCRTRVLDYTKKEGIASSTTDFYLCHWGLLESNQWKKSNQGYEIQTAKMIDMPAINTVVPLKETDQTQDITLMQTSTANNDNTLAMEEDEAIDLKWPKKANTFLSEMCKYYWLSCIGVSSSLPSSDSMYAFPKLSRSDYTLLNELLASRQTLYTSCDLILSKLLVCLEKDAAIYRTKSLCAIGKIATEAPEVLEDKRINKMVIQRIHDTSPSVRDAAINVMSQYLNRLDTIPEPLYKIISARIMDTSLNVRIRVIELLSSLYFKFPDPQLKMNMAAKIILRIGDNEVSVSQLSLKTTQDILFMPFKQIEKDGNDYLGYSFADSPKQHKRKIVELTSIIIGAISKLDPFVAAQNAALSQIVEKTLSEADEKTKAWYQNIFQWIVDSLFERMVALDEEDSMAEFNHLLITVYSFTKSCPHLLRESHISILQPYISVTDQKADWTRIQYILTIYRDVLPSIKHHNLQFIQSTEKVVMQLLSRCPLNIISSGISCLCAIVNTISHQYNLLIRMLGSCIMKLKYVRQLITEGDIQDTKAFSGVLKMLTLTGLLGQHFEYDKRQKEKPAETEALNLVHHGDINALVFDALKFSTNDYTDDLSQNGIQMRLAALRGLGCSDASHPTFMISEESTRLIDTVFDQGTASLKRQLMLVFQEFLMAEGKRMNRCKKEAGMSLWSKQMDASMFLGNTKECVKLDVYRSLVQRYLKNILHCALSDSKDLSCAAFGVVSSVVYQDLAHPRSYMHTIVAAETSPDVTLCNKAYHLHQYAHDKYGSLLYTQMSECLMTSFDYQKQFVDHPTNLRGYLSRNGEAGAKIEPLLGLTFSILKKKKKAKFDFLLSLIKPFDFDLKNTSNEDIRLDYLKYLGENMMALNLARSDEVLHMVYVMDRILMTLGADLLCYVHSLKKKGIIQPIDPGEEEVNQPPKEPDRDLMIASKLCVAMFILIRVKILLLEVYGILDDEIRHYRPNSSTKGREITRNLDIQQCIDWNDLYYYRKGQNMCTLAAMDACLRFEHLLMNDTIASVIENT